MVLGMSEFTYELPNEEALLKALLVQLKTKGLGDVAGILKGCKCEIVNTGRFAYPKGRWNAYWTDLVFRIPLSKYELATTKISDDLKYKIMEIANDLIPKKAGLDILYISLSPSIETTPPVESSMSEKGQGQLSIIIHDQQTEEARLLLYTLENMLRQFVSSKILEKKGNINEAFQKDWESSRKKEFLPPRKPLECDLINYSTFDQIKKIITQNENWSKVFKEYFGRPDGVISRINELDDIRDTIAHNRIISNFDFESLKTLCRQILGCLEE